MIQEPSKPKNYIRNMTLVVLIVSILFGIIVYITSLFLTPKYQAETKILVTYSEGKNGDYNSKAQDAAEVFSEIVNSKNFVEDIFSQAGENINQNDLEGGLENFISAVVSEDSPVITIKLFYGNKASLSKVSNAVLDVLNNRKIDLGKAQEIKISQVDAPYVYSDPVSPKPLKNGAIAFGILIVIGAIYIYTKS